MRTPEARIKDQVKTFLRERGAWFTVGTGLVTLPIDVIGCYKGRFFAIEVKAPGKKPTPRQLDHMAKINISGGVAFWGDNADQIINKFWVAMGIE